MKAAVLGLTLAMSLGVTVGIVWGKPASAPAEPAPANNLQLSSLDQAVIETQESAEWMAQHHARVELRDMNRAMERMCDRLQDSERRMALFFDSDEIRKSRPCCEEIGKFGDNLVAISRELSKLNHALTKLAQVPTPAPTPATPADLQAYREAQRSLFDEMDRAQKHSDQFHAWVIAKPAPRGLDEMSRDLDLARADLKDALSAMDHLSLEAGLGREGLEEMKGVQAQSRAVLQALGDAQDRVTTLAGTS
jgi:DNA repair exonuclease SbcCD ATPase subunit